MERLSRIVTEIEETFIALLLAGMTLVTFTQVVARYVFNSGAVWALEVTVVLFAWLILFGMSYGLKLGVHLGVDALINLFSSPVKRILAAIVAAGCLAYGLLLLYGSIEYWNLIYRIGLEVEDIPFPAWLQEIFGLTEDGEPFYEKLPRYVIYAMLPVGLTLFSIRALQAGWAVATGRKEMLIVSHEMEETADKPAKTTKGEA
ncbi:MAG: TRAP transporter small permease [Rhodospirillales bacterium]